MFNKYANRDINPGGEGNPRDSAEGNISLDYGKSDPHSGRSVAMVGADLPGIHEGISTTADKGAFKGPQDQKNS